MTIRIFYESISNGTLKVSFTSTSRTREFTHFRPKGTCNYRIKGSNLMKKPCSQTIQI